MKVATWNVNSLKIRMPRVPELEATGYQAVHHSAGRWAGVAIAAPVGASMSPIERDIRKGPKPSDHAPLLAEQNP